MEQLKISDQYKNILQKFIQGLKDVYPEELLSIILYGSAASGEFVDKHSNLNLLVVLKNTDLEVIKKSSKLVRKFKMINALFLTEDTIANSIDIFPIEFLDMQENYFLLYGKDVLKDIQVDIRHLQFQCEQELKAKLIKLRQTYLLLNNNMVALRGLLFMSFTSILHILRNVLRIKGRKPPYLKQEVLKELALEFKIDIAVWEKILSAKNKKIKLTGREIEQLFISFVRELESVVAIVDKL
jgi:predicted nucleotidyltransferase